MNEGEIKNKLEERREQERSERERTNREPGNRRLTLKKSVSVRG